MRLLGIVAEYDPFHLGHAYHLAEAKRRVAPDFTLIALSGPFRQRGEPALLSPGDRAACVLTAGADAVLELPVLWTVRDAEHYALGAVSVLSRLGCTHLAFGAEADCLPLLNRLAGLLEEPSPAFRNLIRKCLREGFGYPAALSRAADSLLPEAAGLLASPNNILAVCYLRALRRLGSGMIPVLIPRRGNARAVSVDPDGPSASALREALRRGQYAPAFSAVPACTETALRKAFLSGRIPDEKTLDLLLLSRLRAMSAEELRCLPDVSEGLDAALRTAAVTAAGRRELLERLVSRRYTAARISRVLTYALLGVTREQLDRLPLPETVRLTALRAHPALTAGWRALPVRIVSDGKEWARLASPAELAAWKQYALLTHRADTLPMTDRLFTLPADP